MRWGRRERASGTTRGEAAPLTQVADAVVLRVNQHGTLLDVPISLSASADCWVATVWSDPAAAGGWLRQRWDWSLPGWRWRVPADVAMGTVVEFGAEETGGRGARWYGWIADLQPSHLILVSAAGAAEAEASGHAAVALWKQAQLDATANTWRSVARVAGIGE